MLQEARQLPTSVKQLGEVHSIGDIPLTVISAGKTENVYKGWMKSQSGLLSLSSNSSHVIVKESGHFIHLEHPEVVNRAIKDLIKKCVSLQAS